MSDSNEIKTGKYAQREGEVILREHEFDGIQEFDQKLPNWWLFTFYGAVVVFAVIWFSYYNAQNMKNDRQLVIERIQAVEAKKQAALEVTLKSLTDEVLIEQWSADPSIVAAGQATFTTNCVACHGADLSGTLVAGTTKVPLPGRSLNDAQWTYGGKPMEIYKLIYDGTPKESAGYNGARMQAWGQTLSAKQVAELVAFIISKNPKEFNK